MFSKACKYGIRATLYIAQAGSLENPISLKEVAASIDTPPAFTGKILQKLVKAEIINSIKGPGGGFHSSRTDSVKLKDIVVAIDGSGLLTGCGMGLSECNSLKPCPLHYDIIKTRVKIKEMLESKTLNEIVGELDLNEIFLKR